MDIQTQLFEGQKIRLAPIDHEKDPEVMARWTDDPEYLRMLGPDPARPQSTATMKKKLEAIEKEADESKNSFYFTIRLCADDRLVGFARISWIEWNHGTGHLALGIGDAADRRQGYGSDALRLLLHYCFAELNLYRLSVQMPEYNQAALGLFQKFGFVEEVRRRQAIHRDGRRWDMLHLGLLQEEWPERTKGTL